MIDSDPIEEKLDEIIFGLNLIINLLVMINNIPTEIYQNIVDGTKEAMKTLKKIKEK